MMFNAKLRGISLIGLVLVGASAPSWQDAPAGAAEAAARRARGEEALAAGDLAAARNHLLEAWVHTPRDPELARLLVEASAKSKGAAALWARSWIQLSSDAAGRVGGDRATATRMEALAPEAAATERARAGAFEELSKLVATQEKRAKRQPAAALVARWARDLAAELARSTPSLEMQQQAPGLEVSDKLAGDVIESLERASASALAQGRAVDAVRAARLLRGLAVQGGFKDLQGERPKGLARLSEKAQEALSRARARLAAQQGEPLTVDQLFDMEDDQAREFTRLHSDMASPGLAVTPQAWYRVETCCGWATLLGVADTLELHHQRLSNWYGVDPFVGRPGLVRVVPEAAGLESEGAPFWWAGGFQGGDTTVMRFSCGTIEGLGHGLTHELTHRFDGALFPGQPAWLSEGKAVWTGGSYSASSDTSFVERAISFGTVEGAWIKGYGGLAKLRTLLDGSLEDYRDNYVAGYALYVYLKLWEVSGRPLFAARLDEYMKGCAGNGKDPVGWFERCFADGAAGRPQGLEEFAKGFESFGRGFYWDDRAEWTANYVNGVPQAGGPWVYDEPTWTWSRSRAEPYFGQDHAWRAGELLAELGKTKEAVAAFVWSAAMDEASPGRDALMAELLATAGEEEAAWVLRNGVERPYRQAGDGREVEDACPLRLPKTTAFLAALRAEAEGYSAGDLGLARAALLAEHDSLARSLGAALAPIERVQRDVKSRSLDLPEERLGLEGWGEDGLTGYEERRAEHCWYVEEDGDLHVGRFRPRESSGALDRTAHNRHAFARTQQVQPPGRYLVRCRVQFTTSYVSGALILGYGRRDRNIRLGFSAGDFYYSIGKKEQPDVLEGVGWRIEGLRDRDGPLQGSLPGGRVDFDEPRTNFELAVIVDEAAAHVWIEGEYAGTYHTVDGAPIWGAIGFATGMGAMRVIDPRVQRLDRALELGLSCSPNEGDAAPVSALSFARPARGAFTEFVNQRVRGARPGPRGSLFVWTPLAAHEESEREEELDGCAEKAAGYAMTASELLEAEGAAMPILLAVPSLLGEARLERLRAQLAELPSPGVQLELYNWAEPDEQDLSEDPGSSKSWLGFLDAAGVLRSLVRFYGFTEAFTPEQLHWVTVFKDHSRPR
jgi:hypothetical protein